MQNYTKVGKDAPDMYVMGGVYHNGGPRTHVWTIQYPAASGRGHDLIRAVRHHTRNDGCTDDLSEKAGLNPVLLEDGTLEPSIYAELDVRTDWRF